MKDSALLLVRPDKLNINQRTDNNHDEDLVLHSIAPEDIDHILIDRTNLSLAKETFSHLPTSIPNIGKTNSEIYQIFQGHCRVPDYAQALKDLTTNGDVYWGHIIRLPSSE
jgi:hypothetical protein|tara:strand:+ start:507 stop:839 length:333 start_codon:yes stop_codon:yes gene_type:complete